MGIYESYAEFHIVIVLMSLCLNEYLNTPSLLQNHRRYIYRMMLRHMEFCFACCLLKIAIFIYNSTNKGPLASPKCLNRVFGSFSQVENLVDCTHPACLLIRTLHKELNFYQQKGLKMSLMQNNHMNNCYMDKITQFVILVLVGRA